MSAPTTLRLTMVQELSPVSVSALVGSPVDKQPDGSGVPSAGMHAVTLDSLRVQHSLAP